MLHTRFIVFTYCIFLLTLAIGGDKGTTSNTDDAVVVTGNNHYFSSIIYGASHLLLIDEVMS